MLGRHERWAAETYRGIFVDLDDLVARVRTWVPLPCRILEVGCGEGAVTQRVARAYPSAAITAIDIAPTVGRLFDGPRDRVSFAQQSVLELAEESPGAFDLVILSDVLHHVPASDRPSLLSAIDRALAPGGSFILKDWIRSFHPIHWACYCADRFITGDDVEFWDRDRFAVLLTEVFGPDAISDEATIAPWVNNIAILVRRQAQGISRTIRD